MTDEHVVEVVRDAAGEPSDRFHFLGLAKLILRRAQNFFGPLLLGQISRECDAVRILQHGCAHQHRNACAVFRDPFRFPRRRDAVRDELLHLS